MNRLDQDNHKISLMQHEADIYNKLTNETQQTLSGPDEDEGNHQNTFVSFGRRNNQSDYFEANSQNQATFKRHRTDIQKRLDENNKILLNINRIDKHESKYVKEFKMLQRQKHWEEEMQKVNGHESNSNYSESKHVRQKV